MNPAHKTTRRMPATLALALMLALAACGPAGAGQTPGAVATRKSVV